MQPFLTTTYTLMLRRQSTWHCSKREMAVTSCCGNAWATLNHRHTDEDAARDKSMRENKAKCRSPEIAYKARARRAEMELTTSKSRTDACTEAMHVYILFTPKKN